jgi:hypothetical protein
MIDRVIERLVKMFIFKNAIGLMRNDQFIM